MATYRDIPEGSVEIQKGLWLYSYEKTLLGNVYTIRQLYASEDYCFYDTNNDEYDEEGNLIRIYYIYMSLGQTTDINDFVSVLVEEGMEIAGNTNKPEIA